MFANWRPWHDRDQSAGLEFPGVYVLAVCDLSIAGDPFEWIEEIIYIGMTNSRGGLRSRLGALDRTLRGGRGHGGAMRMRFRHPDYSELASHLFVTTYPRGCRVSSQLPDDLLVMGDVARHEYECFAEYARRFGRLPEFNDMKRSPKA